MKLKTETYPSANELNTLEGVPEGWTVVKLRKVADIQQGVSKGRKINPSQSTLCPYLRVANVKDGYLDLSEIKLIEIVFSEIKKYALQEGDILITEGGDPDKLGRGSIWKNEVPGAIFQNHLFRIRPNSLHLSPFYLYVYLQSFKAKSYFLSCSKQTTGIASINSNQVNSTPILLPPLSEQRAIAGVLGKWDDTLQKTQELIAQKEQRKKWLMQVLLTGKKRLPGFEGEWREVKLGEVGRIPAKKPISNLDGKKLLTVKLYAKGVEINPTDTPVLSSSGRPYFEREEGEILIGRQNIHNGGIGIVPKELHGNICSNAITSFRVNLARFSQPFILNYLTSPSNYRRIEAFMGGTGQKELSEKQFLEINLKIPASLPEQTAIAQVLDAADKEINLLKEKLRLLQEQKKGLMQVLLTGKKRLNQDFQNERINRITLGLGAEVLSDPEG